MMSDLFFLNVQVSIVKLARLFRTRKHNSSKLISLYSSHYNEINIHIDVSSIDATSLYT